MNILCLSVGKASDSDIQSIQDKYQKRLSIWANLEWRLVPADRSVDKETEVLLNQIKPQDFVILLDETGKMLSVEVLEQKLNNWLQSSKRLVFIIGGAYGVGPALFSRADYVWSLSSLVFPHQLVRILLSEQLYRVFSLHHGQNYHHK